MLNDLNNKSDISKIYGVNYFEPGAQSVKVSSSGDLYYYKCSIGDQTVEVETGDCVYWISDDSETAYLERGPTVIKSKKCATVIRGYMPEKTWSLHWIKNKKFQKAIRQYLDHEIGLINKNKKDL